MRICNERIAKENSKQRLYPIGTGAFKCFKQRF